MGLGHQATSGGQNTQQSLREEKQNRTRQSPLSIKISLQGLLNSHLCAPTAQANWIGDSLGGPPKTEGGPQITFLMHQQFF